MSGRRGIWLLLPALVAALALGGWLSSRSTAMAGETVEVSLSRVAYATFGGGCFWCMEPPFDKLDGVLSTTSGYAGGREKAPTYEQVSSGRTGHVEVVQVAYDPERVSYAQLLDVYWRNVDPFAVNRQFCDAGPHYRSVIYWHDAAQRDAATASREAVAERFGQPVATEISALDATFHPAEEYHQDYYLKNPIRYRYYRNGCGRDQRLEAIWGKSEAAG